MRQISKHWRYDFCICVFGFLSLFDIHKLISWGNWGKEKQKCAVILLEIDKVLSRLEAKEKELEEREKQLELLSFHAQT